MTGHPWARFDDLRAGVALLCGTSHRILVADHPDEVAGVLAEVDSATGADQWAFGYVVTKPQPASILGRPCTHRTMTACRSPGSDSATSRPGPGTRQAAAGDGRPEYAGGRRSTLDHRSGHTAHWQPTSTPEEHRSRVGRVRERIAEGETYRCNLTVRMRGRVDGDPLWFYRDVVLSQGGAYNAYLDLGRLVVAADLDDGPIIEQDVVRVTHAQDAEALVAIGKDVKRVVLAQALRLHVEDRVIITGHRTIVFT